MKKLFTYFFWTLLIQASLLSQAQTLEDQFKDYTESKTDEQVHLQLSELTVGAGEAIWFQANITNTDSSEELSRVVYLELFNQQQQAVVQGIFSASSGIATGQLTLPDSLASDWYQLRAYTQRMRNGYPNKFFTQPLLVIGANTANPTAKTQADRPNLVFYPEGGNWVADQENCVVVWLPTQEAKLEVLRTSDSTVVASTAIKNKLGKFTFTPRPDSSYVARLIASDTSYVPLPEAETGGHTLQVRRDENHLVVEGRSLAPNVNVFLAIRSRSRVLHYQPINQNSYSVKLPISRMQGLVEIALFDYQAEILARRMMYLENQRLASINLSEEKITPRGEMSVSLNSDPSWDGATLSLTIRKDFVSEHSLSVAALDNFGLSGVLLSEGIAAQRALQWINQWLVTQTTPWPSWSDMLATKPPTQQFVEEDEMLLITGRVQTSQPFDEGDQVLLSIPGDNPYFEYSEIAEDGKFAILVSRVYGLQNSILQYRSATDNQPQSIQWEIDSTFAPPPTNGFSPPSVISDDNWEQLVDSYQLRKRIQQTYYGLEEEQPDVATKPKSQFRFYGAPNVRVNPDDYISLPSFEEICRELLPGVRLVKKKKKYDFDVFDPGSRNFLPNEPTLFLDGVPIQDQDYIINFPPDQISYIETVNRRTYYGNVRLDGVIAVYTQQERAYEEALSERALFTTLPFYTLSTAFSTPDSLPSTTPDFRTLLYWQPKINSDSDKSFSFSASDELGTYEVIVQGVNERGQFVQGRATFEVKPADLP